MIDDEEEKVYVRAYIYRPDLGLPSKVYTNLCFDAKGNTLNDYYDEQNFSKTIRKDIRRQEIMDAYFDNKNKKISIEG